MSEFLNLADSILRLVKVHGGDDADVVIAGGKELEARVRLGEIESIVEAAPQMLGLRVFSGGRTALTYTSDFRETALGDLVREAVEMAKLSDVDPHAGLPDPAAWAQPYKGNLDLYDEQVVEMTTAQKIETALATEAIARQADPRINNSGGASFSTYYGSRLLANTRGFQGEYKSTSAGVGVEVMADDVEGKKQNGSWWSTARFLSELEEPGQVGRRAAERALRQLGARKVPTRKAPVVWDQVSACTFVGMIARAVNGEAFYRGTTFLAKEEGRQVAASLFNLSDDPLIARALASRPFDDEGVTPSRHELFVDGVYQTFLFDTYTGRKAGRQSTGNASRSIGGAPGVGTSNLVMQGGAQSPEAIIAGVQDGLYLTTMLGFSENTTTGDFSRGAAGLWIENGKLTYPVAEINISGNLRTMLAGITALGNDATFRGSVSAPTFLLDEMMISGL